MVGKNELIVFLWGMSPIGELRFAIPLGYLCFHIPIVKTFILSVAGNIVPIAPILLFFKPISHRLRHIKALRGFFCRIFKRARKNKKLIERYGALGLAIFVAIPLPMTGAWTGAAIASIFRIRFRYAFWSVVIGVIGAGIIVSILALTGRLVYRTMII